MEKFNNKKKGFMTKYIRYSSEEQYRELIKAFENNDKEKVLDIVFEIYYRGDFL